MTATSLYRLYDASDRLLYVGIAGNPGRRFEQHAKEKPWWGEVHRIAVEHFATRVDAERGERDAIIAGRPKYNVVHNAKERGGAYRPSVRFVCGGCARPIADGAGYLEVGWNEVNRVQAETIEWERQHPQAPHHMARPLTLSQLMELPDDVEWGAWHAMCDPDPERAATGLRSSEFAQLRLCSR